jgi:hypothetical protein
MHAEYFPQKTSLYMPPEMEKLYNGETRTWEGKPGKGYWQNSADYTLKAELDPATGELKGEGVIRYRNNSPDTLYDIAIFLYNNIYKKGQSRGYGLRSEAVYEGVDIISLKFNGQEFDNKEGIEAAGTLLYIAGIPAVIPGGELLIEVHWELVIPSVSPLRHGIYPNGSVFAAYWFPRVGVYDDIEGWDFNEYTGPAEFYNDFGNYDVEITLPGEYLLWATGTLMNPEEIYNSDILERYIRARNSEEVIRIVTEDDYNETKSLTRNSSNTWKFNAENVSDFSFGLSKDYMWDGSIIDLDGEKIFVDAAYPIGAAFYDEAVKYSKEFIEFSSMELPGVKFPFPEFTTFCNGRKIYGGMETPMMANNAAPEERNLFITLLAHEIWHTYFPFFVGINEKKYAWMDEGWMSYLPHYLLKQYDSTYNYLNERKIRQIISSYEYEVPPMIISSTLSWPVLAQASYIRTLFAFHSLAELLGKDIFKKALKIFIDEWKWKHPTPYDFFFTFNRAAGEDLSWFWRPWFFELGYTDLALEENNNGAGITVVNNGNQPVPVKVEITYNDGSSETIEESTEVWKNSRTVKISGSPGKKIASARIITDEIDDKKPDNDFISLDKK